MKRFSTGLVAGILAGLILATTTFALAADQIKLIVNGKEIQCDVPPQIINGRTMVPARFLAEALGATVEWDGANNAVVVTGGVQVGAKPEDLPEATQPTIRADNMPSQGMINLRTDKNILHDAQKEVIIDGEIYITIGSVFVALENANNKIQPLIGGAEQITVGQTVISFIDHAKDVDGHRFIPISLFEKTGILKYSWDNNTKTLTITH